MLDIKQIDKRPAILSSLHSSLSLHPLPSRNRFVALLLSAVLLVELHLIGDQRTDNVTGELSVEEALALAAETACSAVAEEIPVLWL